MIIAYILITPLLILFLNFLFNKENLFQSLTGDKHQRFIEKKNIPLTGGIAIIFLSFFINNFNFEISYLVFIICLDTLYFNLDFSGFFATF